jgi:hypothetical protein
MDEEPLRKINYFTGLFLRAEDLRAAEDYRDRTRWMHNLLLHGPGIVRNYRDGLQVTVNDRGNEITVGTGLAIDPLGREILLNQASTLAIRRAEYDLPTTVYVTLSYDAHLMDFRANEGNRDYSGHAFKEELGRVALTTHPPDAVSLELVRVKLTKEGTRVRPAADPAAPGQDELDASNRLYTGVARALFRLDDYAEVVASGEANVPGKDTARIKIDEVAGGDRGRVFSVSVFPRATARIRWCQEAVADQRGTTQYMLILENRENNDAVVRYKVYRLG